MSHNEIPMSLQRFLDAFNAQTPIYVAEILRAVSETIATTFALSKLDLPLINDVILQLEDRHIETRIYHPNPQQKLPLIFYYHGGGHMTGSISTHDALCRRIAVASEAVVVSVGYRLAPEFPYPAGLLDCIAAFTQRDKLLKDLPINTDHVFLAGDSAGGNLALSVAHQIKVRGEDGIKGLALIYPSVDFSMNYDSYQRNGAGFLLSRERVNWYFDNYFAQGGDRVVASPIYFPHLELLPPLYIAAAEYDPLFDEAIVFAKKVTDLGVPVTLEEFKGMIHAFAQLELLVSDQVFRLAQSIGNFIKLHQ